MSNLRFVWVSLARSCLVLLAVSLAASPAASAERFDSTSYSIDSSVSDSFGGSTSATSYSMRSSGGEAIVGDGSAGSYKIGQGYIPQLEKSIEIDVQPSGVSAYYALDENFGTRAYDDSLNSATATLNNAPMWSTGKIGKALSFNGTNQSADITSATANNISTLTISAWVQTSQTPGAATPIIQKWAGGGGYPYALILNTNGTVSFSASDGTNTPSVGSGATVINDGVWHHIAGVRTGGTSLKMYVDGSLKNTVTDTTTAASTTNSANLTIATRSGGSAYFNGLVDEVKLYTTALADNQVSHDYTAQNTGVPSAYTFGALATTSETVSATVVVQTDAPGYTVNLNQNQNLTSGGNSISPISGSIASPALWTEGTTNGFGFTVTSGPGIDPKWGSNPNYKYAAVPGSATSIQTRSGYTGGTKDVYTLQYRADVPSNQPTGNYKNQVTYTATVLP